VDIWYRGVGLVVLRQTVGISKLSLLSASTAIVDKSSNKSGNGSGNGSKRSQAKALRGYESSAF
jgi:hypothetical protein